MLVGTTVDPFAGVINYDLLINKITKKNGFTNEQKERLQILGIGFYTGYADAQLGEFDLQPTGKVDLTKGTSFQKLFEDGYAHWWLPGQPGRIAASFVKGCDRPKRKHFASMTAKAVREFGDIFYEIFKQGRYGKYITTSRTAFKIWLRRDASDVNFASISYPTDLRNLKVTVKAAKLFPKEYLKWKEKVEK